MAAPSDSVLFEDLPTTEDDEQLHKVFGAYGIVKSTQLLPVLPTSGKRSAVVKYETVDDAKWIVEHLNGNVPQGLTDPIKCSYKMELPPSVAKGKGKGKSVGKGMADEVRSARPAPYVPPSTLAPLLAPAPLTGKAAVATQGTCAGKGLAGSSREAGTTAGLLAPLGTRAPNSSLQPAKDVGGKTSIKILVNGILDSGALPGGVKYSNDENTLFVGGLPKDTTDLELYEIFSPFGALAPKGILAMRGDGLGPNCKGYGFVNFMSRQSAQTAMQTLHGTTMPGGAVLRVMTKKLDAKKGKGAR